MPDASGGIATGLYWIATGKLPIEDLDEDSKEPSKEEPEQSKDEKLVERARRGRD